MSNDPSSNQAQDSIRDAAALLLAYVRKDVDTITAINDSTTVEALLSGLLFTTGMIVVSAFGDESETTMESLVRFFAEVPEVFWDDMASNAQIIQGHVNG